MAYCLAKYSFQAQPEHGVPAARTGDRFTIVRQHTNGWLEIRTPDDRPGFLPPAWVDLEPGAAQFLAKAASESGDTSQPSTSENLGVSTEQSAESSSDQAAESVAVASESANELTVAPTSASAAPTAARAVSPAPPADGEKDESKDDPEGLAILRKAKAPAEGGEPAVAVAKRITNRISLDFSAQLESKIQQTLSPNTATPKKIPPAIPTRSSSADPKLPDPEGPSPRKPHRMAPPPPVARRPDLPKSPEAPLSPAPSGAPPALPASAAPTAAPPTHVAGVALAGLVLPQHPQSSPATAPPPPPAAAATTAQALQPPVSPGRQASLTLPSEPSTPSVFSPQSLVSPDAIGEDMTVAEAKEIQETTGFEALIDRRVLLEDGKEPKKNRGWVTQYAVLAGPALYFFKDEKEKRKKKKYLTTTLFEPHQVTTTTDPARRGTIIVITTEKEKLLLHSTDEETMRRWTAALVPPNAPSEDVLLRTGTLTGALARPTSVGSQATLPADPSRSPRAGRASTFGVVEEEDRSVKKDSTFVRYLNKYLRSRPAKEDLKRKGIIEDAMFGSTIHEQVAKERETGIATVENVPLIVVKCTQIVDRHLSEQGIYRISGNASQIQKLVGHANADISKLDLSTVEDAHAVTGLLKLFFRELSEPIFTDALYPEFIAAAKIADKVEKQKALRGLLHQLIPENRATLRYLLAHLSRVAAQGDVNKMQINNLSIVFGPTLLRRIEPTPESIIMDSPFQSGVVEELLRDPSLLD
eukprot:m.64279 g.64279  ORF g.64279 m.64279 type:complete len:756 (+) comp12512_c0_seq2:44-2311(+)